MNSQYPKTTPHYLYILSEQQPKYLELWKQEKISGISLTENPTEATIVLADPPKLAKQLNDFPNLQWAQSTFAGIDTLTKSHLRHDYQLTNVKGIFGQLISEYVLGYSLGYYRHLAQYRQQQAKQQWQPIEYQSVVGKTMLILGTGSIGSKLAETANALGFKAVGVNRSGQAPTPSCFSHCYSIDQIDQALAQADIVVNALPSTEQTRGLLNREHLSHCQQALLFNIGRGDAVDEQGLLAALEQNWLSHAYLDVFPVEPLPPQSAYWQHPNVTITPHIAANSFPEQVFAIFKQNCQHWLANEPLENQVDFQRGY
ncbi:D-2-hydroxyacid dehydrogenase [Vibrio gangliei]|uniref:D-2-hydroxyacid dehydrogenase n=1 Tax=Vibrio gangliei TaxID=2077090 RepID=UPI000D01F375|nr:D-2-hydroxyacid dehydrogenase [Vibrio gangliei]